MRDARDCLSAKTNAYFGFANVADWAYALLITGSGFFSRRRWLRDKVVLP